MKPVQARGCGYGLSAVLLAALLAFNPHEVHADLTRAPKLPVTAAAPAPAGALSLGQPLLHTRINSSFGWRFNPVVKRWRRHDGVDYAAAKGAPVYAAQDGTVEIIGRRRGDGLYIRIRHGNKVETGYAHLSRFAAGLHRGTAVHRGEIIGAVGATGTATGPHLHFEVMVDGTPIDPELRNASAAVQVAQLN